MQKKRLIVTYLAFMAVCVVIGTLVVLSSSKVKQYFEPDPRHAITPTIRREVATSSKTVAPEFERIDCNGGPVSLKTALAKGPVFLIFIMDSCPCSYEAQPFFQRIAKAYGDKVSFIGVTDGTPAQAREWKAHFEITYPVISEPKKDLMHLYKAKHSAYTALVNKDGSIEQLWPGYSQAELKSIAKSLGSVTASNPKLDFGDAPLKPTTGCEF